MKNPFEKEVIKHIYHIVETPAATKLPEITSDLRESLRALQFSPAFNYLLQRLRVQRAGVNNALQEGLNLNETQLRFLQAGLYWLGQIEKDVNLLTQAPAQTPRSALDNEAEEFARIHQQLELVDA